MDGAAECHLRLFHMGSECQKVVNDFFEKWRAVVIEPIFDKAMNVYVVQTKDLAERLLVPRSCGLQ